MSAVPTVRILLVDDSPTVRAVLRRLLSPAADLQVVGEAGDGEKAVQEALRLRPDVVLMDIEMPVLDGYGATEKIMALCPTAIVVFTSHANRHQVRTAFEAIRRGAMEVLPKPEDTAGWEQLAVTLPPLLRAASRTWPRVMPQLAGRQAGPAREPPRAATGMRAAAPPARATPSQAATARIRWVAIGASTGGPAAVHDLLAEMPADNPVSVLIVQHIAAGFEGGFADWLAKELGRDVQLARHGEKPPPAVVRIAPMGAHLCLEESGALTLDHRSPSRRGHRPSADELFLSCARTCPREAAGVLLTGMGSDGAEGLAALRAAGGATMVQDEASSVVFGMPHAALERGAASVALPPRELGRALQRLWEGGAP